MMYRSQTHDEATERRRSRNFVSTMFIFTVVALTLASIAPLGVAGSTYTLVGAITVFVCSVVHLTGIAPQLTGDR